MLVKAYLRKSLRIFLVRIYLLNLLPKPRNFPYTITLYLISTDFWDSQHTLSNFQAFLWRSLWYLLWDFRIQTERLKSLRVHSQYVETLYSLKIVKKIEKVKTTDASQVFNLTILSL